jgi:hypothetical protein
VQNIADGNWGEWTATSDCSVSCGGGSQSRERFCDSPAQSGVGLACIGNSSDIGNCNENSCPIGNTFVAIGLCQGHCNLQINSIF